MKKASLLIIFTMLFFAMAKGQVIVRVSSLLNEGSSLHGSGGLSIYHDAAVDTLISRHIAANKTAGGIDGYRIQVFRRAGTGAREEADKVMARVISDYPEQKAYLGFVSPNLFFVRIGDFRTKIEATKAIAKVKRGFPDSYLVAQKINPPEISGK